MIPGARRGTSRRGSGGTPAGASSRTARSAKPASCCSTVAPHTLAARQLAAGAHASSRARPRRLSTHTARAPRVDGVAQRVGERRGQQPVPGLLVALVDDLDARPRRALDASTARRSPTRPRASTVGAGVSTRTAAPARARALERDVARVPRRRALLLERLVALVDHDHRARGRAPAPTPRCGRRPRRTRRRGPAPTCAVRTASECSDPSVTHLATLVAPSCAASARRACRRRDRSRASTPRAHSGDDRASPPSARRPPTQLAYRVSGAPRIHRGLDLDRVVDARRRLGGDAARRKRGQRARPSATRPSGTGRPRRAAARPTTTASTSRRSRRPRAARRRRRRPSRAPAGRAAARARSCRPRTARGERVGNEVVERRGGSPGRRAGPGRTRVTRDETSRGLLAASSAWSVRSQVKSRSLRPKCPYAAVRW